MQVYKKNAICYNHQMKTHNLRIKYIRPLIPPTILVEELPLSEKGSILISNSRKTLTNILDKKDDRLIAVVGPCSIHDPIAAIDYAKRLKKLSIELEKELFIVMRVYFEKPRTTIGWKGLINDPDLDNNFDINKGLHVARKLLLDITEIGLPAGCEFLDPITPQFIADVVSWGAIGARTAESQVHRNLTSGLSMPVGIKNGTGGNVNMAIDAMLAAKHPHIFLSVTEQGIAAIVKTQGNKDTHIILRGSDKGPNYDKEHIEKTTKLLEKTKLPIRIMVDTSHGNSGKDYKKQPDAVHAVSKQIAAGNTDIIGVLTESFIENGNQSVGTKEARIYGKSVTDACMGWEMTVPLLREFAKAVKSRRTK